MSFDLYLPNRFDTNSDGNLNKAEFERLVLNLNHLGINPDNPNLPGTGKSAVSITTAAAAASAIAAAATAADASVHQPPHLFLHRPLVSL